MSSVKLLLKKDKAKHPTHIPLYARITRNRRSAYIALGITVDEDHWDEGSQRVNILHPNRVRMNSKLARIEADITKVILNDMDNGSNSTALEIKEAYLGKTDVSFTTYANNKRTQLLQDQNYGRYKQLKGILNKLDEYVGGRELQFIEVSYDFLTKYVSWLRNEKKNRPNTIHSDLKFLRQIVREAVRDGIIEEELNAFRRFKFSTEKTSRDYLSEPELSALEDIEISDLAQEYHTYNMFVFACYTGLRVSDLLTLKVRNFDGEHINIQMRKTKEPLSIMVPTKGKEILKDYTTDKRDDEYVFPFLNSDVVYSKIGVQKAIMTKTATCNKHLKVLAAKAGITKNLSFHISRHTFATRALRKGIRIEYVSKLLGHSNLKTTQVYAKIVNRDLDKAMEVFN